jgi:hypothetical protein
MSKYEPGVLGRISIKFTIAVVLAVLAIVVILVHVFVAKAREELQFALVVVGGTAAVYAGYYTANTVQQNAKLQKRRSSFEALAPMNNIDMASIRILVEKEIRPKNISPKELYQKITTDRELLTAISSLLGLFEDISIGIQQDYFDEDILFYSISFLVPCYFDGLRPYIDEERKRDPHFFCEVEKLAVAWKAGKSMMTGKKYEFTD